MSEVYYEWLKAALELLDEDFFSGAYVPQNESDLHCHLYHCLYKVKPNFTSLTKYHTIRNEYKTPNPKSKQPKSIDMVLMEEDEPRLCIELKDSSGRIRKASTMRDRLYGNIVNLENNQEYLIGKGALIPVVIYYFWETKEQVLPDVEKELDELRMKHKGILFWSGPNGCKPFRACGRGPSNPRRREKLEN